MINPPAREQYLFPRRNSHPSNLARISRDAQHRERDILSRVFMKGQAA
jgi:hypothetical protein